MKRKRDSRRTSHAAARRSKSAKGRRSKGPAAAPRVLSPTAVARLAAESVALPSSYGETSLVVFPIQPYAVHACWEVTPETLEQGRADLGAEADAVETVLRFHGVSVGHAADRPGPSTFDVTVDVTAGDWYVDLWRAGQAYVVDLGLRTPSGRFRPLARSNRVETPRAEPALVGAGRAEDTKPVRVPVDEAVGSRPPVDEATRSRPPVDEATGSLLPAEQMALGGQVPRGEARAASRPVGGAGPAVDDVTGQSEVAFVAGISSRR